MPTGYDFPERTALAPASRFIGSAHSATLSIWMGPDEHITRQELELVLRFIQAKLKSHADAIGRLAGMLFTGGWDN